MQNRYHEFEVVLPEFRGSAIGIFRTFMDCGGFFGPLILIFILNSMGTKITFFSAIVLLLINILFTISIKKAKKNSKKVK